MVKCFVVWLGVRKATGETHRDVHAHREKERYTYTNAHTQRENYW